MNAEVKDYPPYLDYPKSYKPKTNADRIRAMSDEELMQFLLNELPDETMCSRCIPTMRTEKKCDGRCKNGVLKWLKQTTEAE